VQKKKKREKQMMRNGQEKQARSLPKGMEDDRDNQPHENNKNYNGLKRL
jgi:hypothetical protein